MDRALLISWVLIMNGHEGYCWYANIINSMNAITQQNVDKFIWYIILTRI
jgi:hypothetical protein